MTLACRALIVAGTKLRFLELLHLVRDFLSSCRNKQHVSKRSMADMPSIYQDQQHSKCQTNLTTPIWPRSWTAENRSPKSQPTSNGAAPLLLLHLLLRFLYYYPQTSSRLILLPLQTKNESTSSIKYMASLVSSRPSKILRESNRDWTIKDYRPN